MPPSFTLAVPVECCSHRLSAAAFASLDYQRSFISVSDVRPDRMFLRANSIYPEVSTATDFIQFGHVALSCMMVALNVACLGHFTWEHNAQVPFPQYSLRDGSSTPNTVHTVHVRHAVPFPQDAVRDLTTEDVRRAALLFSVLVQEPTSQVRHEYLKGIFHLGYHVMDLDFRRDSFSNFYRSIEYLITTRVLKVTKLKNELRMIQEALMSLGLGEAMCDEFKRLYLLRGEQVMHAQKDQRDIEWDDVFKLKILVDAALHKLYQPVWTAQLGGQRMGEGTPT
jgi:hypothetical protein